MPNFHIVERAALFPQICVLCLAPLQERECLDTSAQAPGVDNGRMYICLNCVDDIATSVGLMRRHEAEELQVQNALLLEREARLSDATKGLKDDIRGALDRALDVLAGRDVRDDAGDDAPAPAPRKRKPAALASADLDSAGLAG